MKVLPNHLFFQWTPSLPELGVSMTEPDQAMSIGSILQRVQQGFTTGLHDFTTDYDQDDNDDYDDPTLDPDFNEMDAKQIQYEMNDEREQRKQRHAAYIKARNALKAKQKANGGDGSQVQTVNPGDKLQDGAS